MLNFIFSYLINPNNKLKLKAGQKTSLVDINGVPLLTGDIVEVYNTFTEMSIGKLFVLQNYISNFEDSYFHNGVCNTWQIRKIKSYKDVSNNYVLHNIKFKKKKGLFF